MQILSYMYHQLSECRKRQAEEAKREADALKAEQENRAREKDLAEKTKASFREVATRIVKAAREKGFIYDFPESEDGFLIEVLQCYIADSPVSVRDTTLREIGLEFNGKFRFIPLMSKLYAAYKFEQALIKALATHTSGSLIVPFDIKDRKTLLQHSLDPAMTMGAEHMILHPILKAHPNGCYADGSRILYGCTVRGFETSDEKLIVLLRDRLNSYTKHNADTKHCADVAVAAVQPRSAAHVSCEASEAALNLPTRAQIRANAMHAGIPLRFDQPAGVSSASVHAAASALDGLSTDGMSTAAAMAADCSLRRRVSGV